MKVLLLIIMLGITPSSLSNSDGESSPESDNCPGISNPLQLDTD